MPDMTTLTPREKEFIAMTERWDALCGELQEIERRKRNLIPYDVAVSICGEFELKELYAKFQEFGIFTAHIISFPDKHKDKHERTSLSPERGNRGNSRY